MKKCYEESKFESTFRKFINRFAGIIAVGIIILCLVIAADEGTYKERQGTYHDYNRAIIITGNYATTINLEGYSHETLGHDHYILYATDGGKYECTPENVVFYNE